MYAFRFAFSCRILCLALALASCSGCQSLYYKTMEKFGYHKRDLLVERVEDARDSQTAAKEQFQTALEKFASVVNFEGGELESKYKELDSEFKRSEDRALAVRNRIQSVEDVADALFTEWEAELKEYTNAKLRESSEEKLRATRKRYEQLIGAMHRAESKIGPVLDAFKNQVLYLKHNLNAQAIASLKDELVSVEGDIASLVKEMEASVAEADAFIQEVVDS